MARAMPEQSYSTEGKGSQAASDPQAVLRVHRQRKLQAARLSVASNTALVLLKLGVGFWTGSISVLSEALHSATDLMASSVALLSVRASDTPPDEEHPYGHGKIENVSGLVEALFIALAAVYIVYEAVQKLRAHGGSQAAVNTTPGLAIMALSALVNTALSAYLRRTARATESPALDADARHLQTDVLTSLGVFVGLALVRFTQNNLFDPITALLVAALIAPTAYMLAREALYLLMDTRLPAEEEAIIRHILESDARVLGYHKLRTRRAGSQRHADVHVQIDDSYTLVAAHDLTEELEDRIRAALPAIHIHTHTEPYYAEMRHQREAHGVSPPESESAAPDGSDTARPSDRPSHPSPTPPPPASSGEHTGAR